MKSIILEDKTYINEGYVGNKIIIDKKQTNIILTQLSINVCQIYGANNKKGTGFLCKFPFPDFFKFLPVLITNNHILNENDLVFNNIIKITFDDDNILKAIRIIKDRITYTNRS